jgi:drug/metabolite transporter (DMT)-like permease
VTTRPGRRLLADLALVGVVFIWGSTFVVVKRALEDCSTLLFLALRFTLAAVVLGLVFRRAANLQRFPKGAARAGLLVGGALFLGYVLQTMGLRLTTPARSGLITGFAVVLVPLLGAVLFRTRPAWNGWAGVACATAGLWVLMAPSGGWAVSRGDLLTLLCAVAFAMHVLLVGRYAARVGAAVLATAQVAVAAALSLGSWFWAEQPYIRWTAPLIGAVLIGGVLATALGFTVQTWAQQFTSPTRTALILTLEPVFAWLTSYLVMGETLGARGAAGAVLILAGILVSELKPT